MKFERVCDITDHTTRLKNAADIIIPAVSRFKASTPTIRDRHRGKHQQTEY